jgi:2',3'-cyclic-nucleotide 2'-phosphodiesterase (5'-nucleotidase family)
VSRFRLLAPAVAAGLLAALVAVAPAGAHPPPPAVGDQARTAKVVFLHLADTHGRVRSYRHRGQVVGGYARLATLVQRIRRQSDADRVFLIHAGDVLSRGDRLTRATLGRANLALMNHLRFDAWTPGNGEFYDGLKVLRARIEQASFPVLTTNVLDPNTGRPLGKAQLIARAGPVSVGFYGLCTVYPKNRRGLNVRGHVVTATTAARELADKADLVVAVTHLGLAVDKTLATVTSGTDLVLGGHSHSLLEAGLSVRSLGGGTTFIAHAGEYLQHLGKVEVTLARDNDGWQIDDIRAAVLPLDETVPLDADTAKLVSSMYERLDRPARRPAPATDAAATGR